MSGDLSFSPHLRLGLQCRELKRYSEAERHFKDALSADPHDALALHFLASVVLSQDGREKEALEIADRAIAADPNDSDNHALRSCVLSELDRPREALEAASKARELDPYSTFALKAIAQARLQMKDWAEAETAAREALALDPDESTAANFLAHALRMQGRQAENDEQIRGLLERDPEEAFTHVNAGWSALQRSDHRAAEGHFREALRLDPDCDVAREGLLTSFRARSPFYRGYLRYCLAMARMKEKNQFLTVIAIYIGYKIVAAAARTVSTNLALGVGVLYFLLVLWGFVANAVGNFILLFDRFARHALKKAEKIEAVVVGGGVVLGLLLLAPGIAFGTPLLIVPSAALIAAAIPGSMTIANPSLPGRILFGGAALAVYATGFIAFSGYVLGLQALAAFGTSTFLVAAVVACLTSWLGGIPFLRKA